MCVVYLIFIIKSSPLFIRLILMENRTILVDILNNHIGEYKYAGIFDLESTISIELPINSPLHLF